MYTVTVPRPDVTTDQVTDVLRRGLAARYNVRAAMAVSLKPGGSPHPADSDTIVIDTGSGRLFHAQVRLAHEPARTTLHVTPGGAVPTLRLINRLSVARQVHHVLKAAPSLQ
jgi:hypothetical protein